jgi:chromosome segregation ATPase
MEDSWRAQEDHRVLEEALRARVDSLELEKDRVEANCANVREVLTSWMVTFEVLETSIGDAAARVQHMEDHLVTRSKELLEMSETIIDQAATIRLLQGHIGELELGHGVLRARVINIEVGQ